MWFHLCKSSGAGKAASWLPGSGEAGVGAGDGHGVLGSDEHAPEPGRAVAELCEHTADLCVVH